MCVVTAVIVIAALFSGDAYNDEDSFKAYASEYFKEVDETKNVGQPQELVKFGTPLFSGYGIPDHRSILYGWIYPRNRGSSSQSV